jgi:hypothetical protein
MVIEKRDRPPPVPWPRETRGSFMCRRMFWEYPEGLPIKAQIIWYYRQKYREQG